MKLVWSALARDDRRAIFAYIEADNPRAAVEIDLRLEDAVKRLEDYPNIGRLGRVDGTRELVVAGTPYIIPYQLFDDRVRLLRVLHGAQLWPQAFSGEG